MAIKVKHSGTIKDAEQIFVKGDQGTLYQVNYAMVNNASQTPVTVWDAIFATSRTTTFNTTTSFDTTFATTRDTTQTTSTSFTTSFNTTASTSASTTTTFQTGHQTTTTFNTSRSTTTSYTTSFNTSRSTSRSTTGGWSSYQYSEYAPVYYWLTNYNSGTNISNFAIHWNGSNVYSSGNTTGIGYTQTTLQQAGSYQYQRGTLESNLVVKGVTANQYKVRRRYNTTTSFTTTFGTSNTTSRSTTTTYSTNNLTATSFNTSRSTTTTFDTALGTSGTTSQDTTTTFSTSFDTTNTTSQLTATSNATTVYERVTATGAETEVSSAGAHNIRYWDGSQWTEE